MKINPITTDIVSDTAVANKRSMANVLLLCIGWPAAVEIAIDASTAQIAAPRLARNSFFSNKCQKNAVNIDVIYIIWF